MVVVHGQVHAAAGDAGLVREDGQRGLVLAVVPPVRTRRRDARLDARAPDPRLDDVRVVAVEARGADERAVAVQQVTFRDNHTIIPVPAVRDFGPALFAEVYYTQEDVQAMFLARRSLTASATRALDDGVLDTLDRKATAQLRGLGLEPEERKILGSQLDRAMAVQRSRSVILEYQASPAKQQEPLADYDEVSAHACREGSRAWLLSRDRARAAQVLAAREHEELFGESLRASTARATRRESAERPRRSVIAPAAGDSAAPGDLGDMIRNDTFNNLAALCRRGSLPRNSRSPPQ